MTNETLAFSLLTFCIGWGLKALCNTGRDRRKGYNPPPDPPRWRPMPPPPPPPRAPLHIVIEDRRGR